MASELSALLPDVKSYVTVDPIGGPIRITDPTQCANATFVGRVYSLGLNLGVISALYFELNEALSTKGKPVNHRQLANRQGIPYCDVPVWLDVITNVMGDAGRRGGLLVISIVALTLGLLMPSANAQTVINYPSGFASSSGQIWLENYAALSGAEIHLVPSVVHNGSNAWFETPENIQAFTTTFTFHVDCSAQPSNCGDGLGFMIICACTSGNPTYNPSAGHPGYTYSGFSGGQFSWSQCEIPLAPASSYCFNNGTNGDTGSDLTQLPDNVLVKFDTYNNVTGLPGGNFTGYYTDGEYPQAPQNSQYDMSGSGINMQSGDLFSATLTYDGATLTETVTDTVTNATYRQSYTVNIPAAITANTGFIGFGGGTGAATDDVYLDSWTYAVETPGHAAVTSAPTFSPGTGTYSGSQSVTLATGTSGAIICYTTSGSPATNGSNSCASGTLYSAPVTVTSSETIYAVAGGLGSQDSSVTSASYVIESSVATPAFSPAAGTYTSAQLVSMSDTTSNATIYYTVNGTAPTTSSTRYTGAITVSSTETVEAIAVAPGATNSAVASVVYNINEPVVSTPVFQPAAGTYASAQSVTISEATPGVTVYYTTNGTMPTTTSTVYAGPIAVSSTETLEAMAVASGDTNSAVASAAYTISTAPPVAATPVFSPAPGGYTSAQTVTLSDATAGATIYYTTNGTTPTASSNRYSGPVMVSSTETLEAIAGASGDTNSAVASAAYTISASQPSVAAPTFSPAAGTYASAQTVVISDTISGATIYYTTDGTTPTTSSTRYTGAFLVSSTETLQAIAASAGDSAVVSAVYTITGQPNFTLGASPGTLTVNSGGQGTIMLTVTPENGFDSPVSFACSGLPAGTTCSFAQATVTPSGGAITNQLTISAIPQSSSVHKGPRPFLPFTAFALTVCLFGWGKRSGRHHWLLLAVAYAGLGLLFGCGSSSGSSPTSPSPAPTSTTSAPTASTVTIMSTAGNLQEVAAITLTVN